MSMSRRPKPEVRERQIRGLDLGLPLVTVVGTVRSYSAGRVAWHSHDEPELLFVLEGATTYEFRDGRTVELTGGHFLLVPPGCVHRGAHDVRMPSTLCGIAFDPVRQHSTRNTVFTRNDLREIGDRLKGTSPVVRPFNRELRRIIPRMVEECHTFNSGRRDLTTKASLRALACLAILEAATQVASPGRPDPTELVAAAETFLRNHLSDSVRMPELARHLGLSRARMFEVFKQASGLTPNDCLLRYRIEHARELLKTSDQSITEIALASGFSSSQYFSHVFRKYAGVSPSEYRQRDSQSRPIQDE
jgi:AraC-like DNA-binding protein/quercetin dioxygenase-like cupin family protein